MTSRAWLAALVVLALAWAEVLAQAPVKVHRVGFVGFQSPGLESRMIAYFGERMAELSWVQGHNLSITYRWADGEVARYPAIAEDLVRERLDVVTAPCGVVVKRIRELAPTLPLVVRSNDVKTCGEEIRSVARPGGYTTAVFILSPGATARRLAILKDLIPGLSSVGLLHRPGSQWVDHWSEVEAAVQAAGLRLHRAEWSTPADLPGAFDGAMRAGAGAILTLGDGATWFDRRRIIETAAAKKMPVLYDFGMFPAAELGLVSYAPDTRVVFRQVADRVDQILRGVKPGDIPAAQPQQFRLVINHEAAKALGLTVPPSLQRRENTLE